MKHHKIKRVLAVCGSALALSFAAQAETGFEDIYGNWTFETDIGSCSFEGKATFSEDLDGSVSCEIIAHQVCSATSSALVRQTCKLTRKGDQLRIDSEIAEFLGGNVRSGYSPDNFDLEIKSSSKMEGSMDSLSYAPTWWTREEAAIS